MIVTVIVIVAVVVVFVDNDPVYGSLLLTVLRLSLVDAVVSPSFVLFLGNIKFFSFFLFLSETQTQAQLNFNQITPHDI